MAQGKTFRFGLIGWGLAGRYFHAPFIQQHPGLELSKVVTSRPVDIALFPETTAVSTPDAIFSDSSIDLVVIASPNQRHVEQAEAALAAGKHVVVEKPVAETAVQCQALLQQAQNAQRLLIPFQNRRWDGDFLTVQQIIQSGDLGDIHYFASRWPKYRPQPKQRAGWKVTAHKMNGVLFDLGPHLIDQVICLFGKPESIYAQVKTLRPGSNSDDAFQIHLHYHNGLQVLLEVDQLNPFPMPRFHVRGALGAFEKFGLDPQEKRLVAGDPPGRANFGTEPPDQWGQLKTTTKPFEIIPTQNGNYAQFYEGVYAALLGNGRSPVPPQDVLLQLEIIAAVLQSAQSGRIIQLAN